MTNALVRMLLVALMVCGPIAPAMAEDPLMAYEIVIRTKAKTKGAKGQYSEAVDLNFEHGGRFYGPDGITHGGWTQNGKKLTLQLPDSDVEDLLEITAAAEFGHALELVSVMSARGKAKLKTPKGGGRRSIKGTLKIEGLMNAPGLGLFNVKFRLAMKFEGIEKP